MPYPPQFPIEITPIYVNTGCICRGLLHFSPLASGLAIAALGSLVNRVFADSVWHDAGTASPIRGNLGSGLLTSRSQTTLLRFTKEQPMYHRLIEDYLTHYQPALRADLVREQALQTYIDQQAAAMLLARQQLLAQLETTAPEISRVQRELEADQMVRELFLTPA